MISAFASHQAPPAKLAKGFANREKKMAMHLSGMLLPANLLFNSAL